MPPIDKNLARHLRKSLLTSIRQFSLWAVKPADRYRIVLVTAPDMKTARKLARGALKARLIACANLVPRIESHYWWQGKLESGVEVLLILKTIAAHVAKLEKLILVEHPYDTPEFLVLPLSAGNRRYLDWLGASSAIGVRPARKKTIFAG